MRRRSLDQFLLLSTAVFVVVAIAAFAALQWIAAREIDLREREQTARTLEEAVRQHGDRLAEKSVAQTYWDEAVIHLDNEFSGEWARQFIGAFFWRTAEVERAATLDRNDRVTLAMREGQVAALADASARAPAGRVAARAAGSHIRSQRHGRSLTLRPCPRAGTQAHFRERNGRVERGDLLARRAPRAT